MTVKGTVINIHQHGATVRLSSGALAAVTASELAANRPAYIASLERRSPLELALDRHGRHALAALVEPAPPSAGESAPGDVLVPALLDSAFEQRIGAYLKETQEWAPPDRPPPAERHFIRKKRRAAFFEARNRPT